MSQPLFALSLFFHTIATVIWIGGLFITVLLVWPEVRHTLEGNIALYKLLTRLRKKFFPLSNISLAVLVVTGLFQMTADPNYDGVMQFNNEWSRVMLMKHLAIVGMAVAGLVLQSFVVPALERASVLVEHGKGDLDEWRKLRRREVILTWVNVLLGLLVLGFSAWAISL